MIDKFDWVRYMQAYVLCLLMSGNANALQYRTQYNVSSYVLCFMRVNTNVSDNISVGILIVGNKLLSNTIDEIVLNQRKVLSIFRII